MYILKTNLLSFKASLVNKQALLRWQTSNETAESYFDIQKSMDGNHFFTIGTVRAIDFKHSYSFTDPEILNSFAYYRIVLKEPGGQKISKIEFLNTSDISYGFISVVNPFDDVLSFELNIPQKDAATIIISDAHGRTVRSLKQSLVKGLNEIKVGDLGSLATGTYILQVITSDGIKSRRVVKLTK